MNQTISANFESIDKATFAATNVKTRFDNVKGVKIKYQPSSYSETPAVFSDLFTPVNLSATSALQNGIFPETINGNVFREKHQQQAHATENKKASVEIVAAGENVSNICATLRQGGGLGVKVR